MDTRSGDLYEMEEVKKMPPEERKFMKEVKPTPEQWESRKVGRNDICPCGSGKKFKKCCLVTGAMAKLEEAIDEIKSGLHEA